MILYDTVRTVRRVVVVVVVVGAGETGDRKFRRNITVKLLSCALDQRGTYAKNRGRIHKSEIKKME
jgi:hypothetical protein